MSRVPKKVKISSHALRRIFEREIAEEWVLKALAEGEVIADYPEDRPYPSQLLLHFSGNTPLHVVVAIDEENQYSYIITTYIPDSQLWESDFRTRRAI